MSSEAGDLVRSGARRRSEGFGDCRGVRFVETLREETYPTTLKGLIRGLRGVPARTRGSSLSLLAAIVDE
eukprot:1783827-Pyramimonas_sp.AAC.1